MKKLLVIAATIALMGAGCASQTDSNTNVVTPSGQTTTNQNPNAPDHFPDGQGPGVTVEGSGANGVNVEVQTEPTLTAVVSVDGTGAFLPPKLTVKKGTMVTWNNGSAVSVWVASDPHPTHTGYPGFDSKQDIASGDSWSFTFDKVGTWGYHNHLKPSVKGTIVVTE